MIPVSLTLGGIYSYREKQTIDFQPLTSAGIFGIFGSVGSGKSTILEAISFALYGETERLHKRDDRAYNMMNLQSKELFIDFIFRTGADEQEYRFMVKGKRNNKNFEKITTLDRTAYKKMNGAWEPVETTSITSILQLSYDNFRRTIIIPQGKFQEFLELGQAERNEMMKELFHLQRFDLSDQVSLLETKNNEQRIRLEERLQQTGTITGEEIKLKEDEALLLQQQLNSHQQELTEKRTAEQILQQLKILFARIEEQKTMLHTLQQQQPKMLLLEEQIKSYEFCQLRFKPLFDRSAELQTELTNQAAALQAQLVQLQQATDQLSEKEKAFPSVKAAFENRQQLKARSDELVKIKQLILLRQEMQKINSRLQNGLLFLQEADAELAALQQRRDAATLQIKTLKEHLPDLQVLSEISNWFVQKNARLSAVRTLREEQKQVAENSKLLAIYKKAQFTPAIKKLVPHMHPDQPSASLISQLMIAVDTLEQNSQQREADLQLLLLQQELEEHAARLKPGQPCPLCGALDHPQILSATEVKASVKKAMSEKTTAQKNLAALQSLMQELEIIRRQEAEYAKQRSLLQQRLQQEEVLLTEHEQKYTQSGWEKQEEKKVKEQFTLAAEKHKEIKATEQQLDEIEASLKRKETQRRKGSEAMDELKAKSTSLQAQIDLLLSQFVLLQANEYEYKEADAIEKEVKSLTNGYISAEENYHAMDHELQQLRNTTGQLTGTITAGRINHERTELLYGELKNNIRLLVKDSGIEEKHALELLASPLDVSGEKNILRQFQQKLYAATQLLQEREKEADGKLYDHAAHTQLQREIADLLASIEQRQQQLAGLLAVIKNEKQQLVQRSLITQQLNAILLRGDDIATLKNLFKANGFVTYVSSVHLQQLCNAANERFYKLTRQKMRLELSEGNNFLVRDYMNNGQTRSVKTLSGGQKFQAALSLALALADSIQLHSQSKQNFFFLDEGFGSLDTDSLDLVFETLRSLRKENRIVGIISHVKEMQQEIDTCLSIVNDEEAGSRIAVNW